MMTLTYRNKTAYTGEPVRLPHADLTDAYLTVEGAGPAQVQLENSAGQWIAYPELTFSGPTAQLITLPRGRFRVVVAAATSTSVELRLCGPAR